jgi:hypothetical protein
MASTLLDSTPSCIGYSGSFRYKKIIINLNLTFRELFGRFLTIFN